MLTTTALEHVLHQQRMGRGRGRGTALSPAWSWQRRIPSGCLWLLLVILSGVVPFLVHYNLDNLVSGLCFHVVVPFLFGGRVRVATLRARVATWVCVREGEKARGSREFVQCAVCRGAVCSVQCAVLRMVHATKSPQQHVTGGPITRHPPDHPACMHRCALTQRTLSDVDHYSAVRTIIVPTTL